MAGCYANTVRSKTQEAARHRRAASCVFDYSSLISLVVLK